MLAPPPQSAPADASVAWAVRPTDAEIREAAAYHAHAHDRAGVARMRCLVRVDGGLEDCSPSRGADSDLNYDAALRSLAPLFRLDVKVGQPPSTVVVEQAFPALVDADARLLHAPDAAARASANTLDLRGEVGLRCTVAATGLLTDCTPGPQAGSDPSLVPAAQALAAQYRYAPARIAGRPAPSPIFVGFGFVSRGDTTANWIRKPDINQIRAAWPAAALARRVGGRAVIHCRVTAAGVLARCTVAEESPQGEGFGQAAIALTPNFAMKPATHAGAPIESEVSIPVNFQTPGAGVTGTTIRVLSWLPWSTTPTLEEVRRAYPAEPAARHVGGSVAFLCQLRPTGEIFGCDTTQEFPASQGFASAARKLLPRFKGDVQGVDPKLLSGARVQLTVRFSDHSLDPASVYQISQVDWVKAAEPEVVRAAYPRAAAASGVQSGRAVVACVAGADGALNACKVQSETPAGLGFGDAVVQVVGALKMNRRAEVNRRRSSRPCRGRA